MFPLFSSREDVVPDQRIADLIEIVENLFGVYSLALGEAAAVSDRGDAVARSRRRSSGGPSGGTSSGPPRSRTCRKSSDVKAGNRPSAWRPTLRAWREAGEAAGDISFWRTHVEQFESVKSYALVVDVLLRRRDHVAAMGLLIQWLSNAESVGLESEGYSFHALLVRWMQGVLGAQEGGTRIGRCWPAIRRLFDFLEANAGSVLVGPHAGRGGGGRREDPLERIAAGKAMPKRPEHSRRRRRRTTKSLFEAAYEGVVYRDSTRDGREGDTLETGPARETAEVDALTRFFDPRLRFINTLAHAWLMAALRFAAAPQRRRGGPRDCRGVRAVARRGHLGMAPQGPLAVARSLEAGG